jgi:hypothetical protein
VLYTFYPRKAGGSALSLESHDDADDAAALRRARAILEQHRSAAQVSVWLGDRLVGEIRSEAGSELLGATAEEAVSDPSA